LYGVRLTQTIVVVDQQILRRFYHRGRLTTEELEERFAHSLCPLGQKRILQAGSPSSRGIRWP
jgi:hypothetical protein